MAVTLNASTSSGFVQTADTSGIIELQSNGTTALLVNSSNVVVNGSTVRNSSKLSVDFDGNIAGGIGLNDTASANGSAYIGFLSGGTFRGNITNNNNAAVAYNTSSDYRLKENVLPMTNALDVVSQLNPVTYTWKSTGNSAQGFIAHELQAVVPDCVTGQKDAVDTAGNPIYQGVDTSFLVATLTSAIQELNAKVNAQALEIQTLKAGA
jgi:hypothetical protein